MSTSRKLLSILLFLLICGIIFTITLLASTQTHAREPLYAELVSASASASSASSFVVLATTTDPLFIQTLAVPQISGGSAVGVYCGTTRFYFGDESSTAAGSAGAFITFSPAYVCTGSVWFSTIDSNVNWPVTVTITGYTMTSSAFDEASSDGGGGSGTTTVEAAVSVETDETPHIIFYGFILFFSMMYFIVWNFRKTR